MTHPDIRRSASKIAEKITAGNRPAVLIFGNE